MGPGRQVSKVKEGALDPPKASGGALGPVKYKPPPPNSLIRAHQPNIRYVQPFIYIFPLHPIIKLYLVLRCSRAGCVNFLFRFIGKLKKIGR